MKKKGFIKYEQEDEVDEDGLPICLGQSAALHHFKGMRMMG